MNQSDLENKLIEDFHGNIPIINNSYKGILPTISNKAKIFISQNLGKEQYFKFGIVSGGCSGFEYLWEAVDNKEEDDIVFCDSPKAIIDKESLKFCYGVVIDLEDQAFGKMLKVDNPGAKSSCGCGTSFSPDWDNIDGL